jgi:hypothetical protein
MVCWPFKYDVSTGGSEGLLSCQAGTIWGSGHRLWCCPNIRITQSQQRRIWAAEFVRPGKKRTELLSPHLELHPSTLSHSLSLSCAIHNPHLLSSSYLHWEMKVPTLEMQRGTRPSSIDTSKQKEAFLLSDLQTADDRWTRTGKILGRSEGLQDTSAVSATEENLKLHDSWERTETVESEKKFVMLLLTQSNPTRHAWCPIPATPRSPLCCFRPPAAAAAQHERSSCRLLKKRGGGVNIY